MHEQCNCTAAMRETTHALQQQQHKISTNYDLDILCNLCDIQMDISYYLSAKLIDNQTKLISYSNPH